MKYLKLFENYINEGITFNIKNFGNETYIDTNGNVTTYHRPDLYNILDICWAFKGIIAAKKLITKYGEADFEPDGGEAFNKTGRINLYLHRQFSDKERLDKIIEAIKEFANNHKLKLGKLTAETSNPDSPIIKHKEGEPITNIRVIRIPIIENGNKDEEFQHELHVGNGTAKRILRKMGFEIDDDEWVFTIPAKEIIKRANWAKGNNDYDNEHNQTPDIFGLKKAVNIYNGSSNEADNEFIDTLVDMTNYAIKNGYDTIVGA